MNESKVKKAIKNCINSNFHNCVKCEYDEEGCIDHLLNDVLEIIESNETEIERLKGILESYALQYGTVRDKAAIIAKAKDEARKEFADRLKSKAKKGKGFLGNVYYSVAVAEIDDLVKKWR